MSTVFIEIRVTRVKHGHSVITICPYCNKHPKSFEALRKHLSRNHNNEIGIIEVKKQAKKLYKLYSEAKH
jgi:hypothetical protein